jgi:hypothetical protein
LIVFIALLGSLSKVDMLMLFMFELMQGELHTVDFLFEHIASYGFRGGRVA